MVGGLTMTGIQTLNVPHVLTPIVALASILAMAGDDLSSSTVLHHDGLDPMVESDARQRSKPMRPLQCGESRFLFRWGRPHAPCEWAAAVSQS